MSRISPASNLAAALLLAASTTTAVAGTAPPGYVTGVFAGQPDSAGILPNFNKVSGTSTNNLDIAVPQAVLTHGLNYAYTVSFQDASYTGNCEISYRLTQTLAASRTTLQKGHLATTSCSPGDIYAFYIIGPAIPDSAGPAVLTGMVKFGKVTEKLSVPVLLQ